MDRVAIVTDSGACIPPDLAQEFKVKVLPCRLIWDNEVLRDGIDITPSAAYERLRTSATRPTSSQPSMQDFIQTYAQLRQTAAGIVSIHIPERISGTVQAGKLAAQLDPSPIPIRIIDCGTASTGQGLIVLAAARAALEGASLEEIVRLVEALIPKTVLFASLTDLSFIQRGGRVQAILGVAGSMLKIMPVFRMQRGSIQLSMRPRTRQAALREMVEEMRRRVGSAAVHASVMHAALPEVAAELEAQVARQFRCVELWTGEFTPVMGLHTGPGVIGLAFYTE